MAWGEPGPPPNFALQRTPAAAPVGVTVDVFSAAGSAELAC
jgi:hypothetical protein